METQQQEIEIFLPPDMIGRKILCVVVGLILPVVLIPLVHAVGYSEVIEEISKALVVGFVVLRLPKFGQRILWTTVFGLMLGLSESIFYLTNIAAIGNYMLFVDRLFLTVPMHIITALVILIFGSFGNKNKDVRKGMTVVGLLFGLIVATIIHLVFNHFVPMWYALYGL